MQVIQPITRNISFIIQNHHILELAMPISDSDKLLGMLTFLGAPLASPPIKVVDADAPDILLRGVDLARTNAVLARVLPVLFWRQREALLRALTTCTSEETKRAVGFVLQLTADLVASKAPIEAESLRIVALALLRSLSVRPVVPFFHEGSGRAGSDVQVAEQWGFSLNTSMDNFQQQFDKFYLA